MRTCPKCQRTYPHDMDFCPRDATALVSVATATEAELQATLAQRFRILRRLGGGGMGSVFLAEQIGVGNRPVALKVLLRKLLDDPEFLLRFRNEAASTGRIDHPNVVTIYESGQAEDGTPYIAMQYLEGESLRVRLKARGALPVEECAAIIQQVARGLAAAHKLGIIHRDLKPDNIFLTHSDDVGPGLAPPSVASVSSPTGTCLLVKIVDFGIAKLRESATHTLTGTVLGTPAYMSFEQASGMKSEELDPRSDIYSFGVVAYEMLTGRVPFHSDTPLGYVRKHLSEEPPPFRAVRPELAAPQLEQVVMKALAKNREVRYATVLEFARAFTDAARTARSVESRTLLPATKVTRQPVAKRPRPGLWVGVPLVALLLGLGGWYVSSAIHQRSGSPTPSSTETHRPSESPPVVKPQEKSGASQTGVGQQGPVIETPAATSQSPTKSGINAADRPKQVESAKRQGDGYYDNGEYDNAISSYQAGLKLDPSNAGLRKALRRAQNAKAAEEKFSQ